MIDSITLENWRTHKESTLKFRKGTNVLVGVIGSGKTSVTDGLCYGLFGTFPALKSNRLNGEDVLMRKPVPMDEARVEVCFSVNGKAYKVERLLKRTGSNEARLWANETLIAGPKPTQVTERIEKELDVSYELFTRAVYSEQNQLDYFLKMNPGDRKRKFDELLDLQKYETVRMNAHAVVSHFRKGMEGHQRSLEQFSRMLEEVDVNALRLKISAHQSSMREWEEKESGFREKVASEEKRVKELEIKWERTQALNHILQKKRARQEMLREQVAAFESAYPQWAGKALPLLLESKEGLSKQATAALAAQELYRQREQVMVKAAQKVDFLQNRIREAHSFLSGKTFSEWRGEHTQIMGQRHDLEMRQQHAQQALQNAHSKIKVLQERMHFLEDEEKGLAALHAQCPTCKREMEEGHKKQLLADIVGRRAGLAQELEASEKEQEHLRKDMSGVDAVMKGLQSHVGRLDILLSKEADLIKTEEEMGRATIEWEAAQKQVEAMGPPISNEALEGWRTQVLELEKAVQNHTSVVELGKLGVEMDDLKKQAEAIAVEQDEVVEAHKALSIIQNEWGNARKEKDWIFRMVEELEGRVRDAEKVMGEQEKVRVRIARAGEITEQLGIFSHALQVTQEQLRTSVVEAINAALDEMWPSVYPYQDFRTARLKIEDSDYVLMLQERSGNWVAAESALSGGERSAAALALRMALAFVLTRQLSWVILDEPTHNLDSKSVNMLAMMLRERLPLLVDQVFVITHAPEIEKAATGSLYVLQREKDEDGITIPLLKPLGGGTPVH